MREKNYKREIRMLGILQFITTSVWKLLFGAAVQAGAPIALPRVTVAPVDVREIGPDDVAALFPLCRVDDVLAGFYVEARARGPAAPENGA